MTHDFIPWRLGQPSARRGANPELEVCGSNITNEKIRCGLNKGKKKASIFAFQCKSSCTGTRLFISVTRMVIEADWVTSHWGEMELKICPDGQNKGFGCMSGKQERKKVERGEMKVVAERGNGEREKWNNRWRHKERMKRRAGEEREKLGKRGR